MKASSRILVTARLVAVMLMIPTIVEAQWRQPVVIDGGVGPGEIDLAMSAPGDAMVVWTRGVDVYANYYTRNQGFRGATNIEVSDLGETALPQVAIDNHGRAHAVWMRAQSGTQGWRISHNSFTPGNGGAWGTALYISGPTGFPPQIAMNARGDTHAVWVHLGDSGTRGSLEGRSRAPTDVAFGNVQLLEPFTTSSSLGWTEALAIDGNGNALAAWLQGSALEESQVLHANLSHGITWDPAGATPIAFDVRMSSAYFTEPSVAINALGTDGVVAWHDFEGEGSSARAAVYAASYRTATGHWDGPTLLGRDTSPDPGNALHPQVGVDGSGRMLAIWGQHVGLGNAIRIRWSRRSAGATEWEESRQLANRALYDHHTQLAMNRGGNALAVWLEPVNGGYGVFSSSYSAATRTWSPVVKVSSGTAVYRNVPPKVAIDVNDNGMAIWVELENGPDGVRTRLKASVFDAPQ